MAKTTPTIEHYLNFKDYIQYVLCKADFAFSGLTLYKI